MTLPLGLSTRASLTVRVSFALCLVCPLLGGCSVFSARDTSPSNSDGSAYFEHSDDVLLPSYPRKSPLFHLTGYEDDDQSVAVSPKKPWGDFTLSESSSGSSKSTPWWARVLLWAPNRVLDFIDIFRVDVGAGPSIGAVLRFTKYGQVGYRMMAPLSVRVGAFGRRVPVLLERSNEIGAGPAFLESHDRKVCKGELGLGADLFIVGAYGGVCVEEVLDFVAGIFFFDVMRDDIR